jgi:hypothetical protein
MIKRLRALAAVFAASALLMDAAPAQAVDGEILITQAKVNVGNITPGDAAGFPATISRPGHYKLASNLKAPDDTTAIEVTANNVTIDLNGFTISGNSPGAHIGVYGNVVNRLRIANGTVSGFAAGLAPGGGATFTVENMRVISNNNGVGYGREIQITNSTIANNSGWGINCDKCRVEGNVITGNGGGVTVPNESGLVIGNVIAGNGGAALSTTVTTGYGTNVLFGNNSGGQQVLGAAAVQLHPNVCDPACP